MTVLEAIAKMEKLNKEAEMLNSAIGRLKIDADDFTEEVALLVQIRDEKVKDTENIKEMLSKTPLTAMRQSN